MQCLRGHDHMRFILLIWLLDLRVLQAQQAVARGSIRASAGFWGWGCDPACRADVHMGIAQGSSKVVQARKMENGKVSRLLLRHK